MLSPNELRLAPLGTGRRASGPRVVVVVVLPENVVVVDVEDVDVVDEGLVVVVEDVDVVVDDRGTNVVVVVLEVMDGQGHPTMLLH